MARISRRRRAGRARLCDAGTAVQLGDLCGRQGLPGDARRQYLRAWRLGRGAEPCGKLADLAKSRGDLEDAALWLERGGRREPRQPLWDFRRGWVLGQAGRWAEMRRALRRYLRRPGAGDGAAPVLARVALGDYRRAAAVAEKALDRLDAEGLSSLSRAWPENWLRQHEDAFYSRHLAAVERQARAMPRSPWPPFFQAALHLRRNRPAEAGALASRLARFPVRRYGWMRYVTGLARLLDCRYEDSAREFSAALESRPADWKARCHLAEALLCLGRREEAFAQFGRAEADAARAGTAPEVQAWRGEARLWLGETAAALKDLDSAVEAGAKLALCWRGAARLLSGRTAAARVARLGGPALARRASPPRGPGAAVPARPRRRPPGRARAGGLRVGGLQPGPAARRQGALPPPLPAAARGRLRPAGPARPGSRGRGRGSPLRPGLAGPGPRSAPPRVLSARPLAGARRRGEALKPDAGHLRSASVDHDCEDPRNSTGVLMDGCPNPPPALEVVGVSVCSDSSDRTHDGTAAAGWRPASWIFDEAARASRNRARAGPGARRRDLQGDGSAEFAKNACTALMVSASLESTFLSLPRLSR